MKPKKFSIRAAQKAFHGFKIREICRYKSHAHIEEYEFDVLVLLESNSTNNVFEYMSVEYSKLNDYQKDLYDFIMSLPKSNVWYEWEKEWKDDKYVRKLVKINVEE